MEMMGEEKPYFPLLNFKVSKTSEIPFRAKWGLLSENKCVKSECKKFKRKFKGNDL